jgi:hypothetical protein
MSISLVYIVHLYRMIKSLCTPDDLLTYSMEQSPSWEGNRFLASQEIPRVLLNQKVLYRIQNSSPPVSILSQLNPVHTPTSYFLKIHPTPDDYSTKNMQK